MLPPPPRSTLFPYTTLFRSCTAGSRRLRRRGRAKGRSSARGAPIRRSSGDNGTPPPHRRCLLDRKSTRLNSSHANISYAVFCLKKKKKKKIQKTKTSRLTTY